MPTINPSSIARYPFPGAPMSGFALKQDGGGRWVVSGTGDQWGGIFVSRDAALRFARTELEQAAPVSARPATGRPA